MAHRTSRRFTLATAILALLPGLCLADPVGRLFFTPEQRAAFDLQRSTGVSPISPTLEDASAGLQSGEITLNGIVKRSDGKSTVWVNQIAQNETEAVSGQKTRSRHANLPNVQVYVPSLGKSVNLKVGQSINTETREIREIYYPPIPKERVTGAPAEPSA